MKISVLTLFPEVFNELNSYSIIGRAVEEGIVSIEYINIRDYSTNKHKKVDDYPYGGGPGMLMTPQPIYDTIMDVKKENSKVIYLSPQGRVLDQQKLMELKDEIHLILLNGHYEGVDQRVLDLCVDEEISIGDYVLTGGEFGSMVLMDGIIRLLPGVLSDTQSYEDESHFGGILEYPQYTRPYEFKGIKVPNVLLSGNHKDISDFRRRASLEVTLKKRPDLIDEDTLSVEDKLILKELLEGGKNHE